MMLASDASIPAPVGGWNTRDALDSMATTDAVDLKNWIPDIGRLVMRRGWDGHATGVGSGAVETVFEYHAGSVRKLLATGGGGIYDATSTGSATALQTGYTSSIWNFVNFNGYALGVSGQDTPVHYDGSTLTSQALTGSGLTPSSLNGIAVFKNRVYRWDSRTQDFWYGGLNEIEGTLTKFPLSRVSQFGGNLVAVLNWTLDGGSGIDDKAAFVMSSGAVAVYQGSDPGDAAAWALDGIYHIGRPVGARAMVNIAGDVMVATSDDYAALSRALSEGRFAGEATKGSGAIRDAIRAYSANTGWQGIYYPRGNLLIFNIPVSATTYHQHVMHTVTRGWTRFEGIPARSWCVFNDMLYFGSTDGGVYLADTGTSDNGANIDADGQQAWTDFGVPGFKQFPAIRPVMESVGALTLQYGLGFDFRPVPLNQSAFTPSNGTPWGSPWGSPWSPEIAIKRNWRVTKGRGNKASLRVRCTTKNQTVSWYSTDYKVMPLSGM